MQAHFNIIGIIGAGAMGRGIAQIAAQAGSQVMLFDKDQNACSQAIKDLAAQWDKLVAKGRIEATVANTYKARLSVHAALNDLSQCGLVIEAIVERLDIKRELFAELESVVSPHALLVTNTSGPRLG